MGGEAEPVTAEDLKASIQLGLDIIRGATNQLCTMTDEELGLSQSLSMEGEKFFGADRAIINAFRVGVKGPILQLDRMDYESLLCLQKQIDKRVQWIETPNGEKGGH